MYLASLFAQWLLQMCYVNLSQPRFSVSDSVELSSTDDLQKEEGMWKILLSGGLCQNATVIHHACMAARSTVAPPVCNPLFISINILYFFFS